MKKLWLRVIPLVLLASLIFQFDYSQDGGLRFTGVYAQASGDLTISWTPPTQYTDGAPLLEQELASYTFYCDGAVVTTFDSIIGTWSRTVSTASLSSGNHACVLTVTTLEGVESGPSNTLNFTIGPRVPMAPAGLTSV